MKYQIKILILISVMLLSLFVFQSNSITENKKWTENFENGLNTWDLYENIFENVALGPSLIPNFKTDNGILTTDSNSYASNSSFAWHNSTVSYGTWRFDLYLQNQDCAVDFITSKADNNYNFSGVSIDNLNFNPSTKLSGFFLWFIKPDLNFLFSAPGEQGNAVLKVIEPDRSLYNAFHSFYITRDLTGEFKVYMDKILIFDIIKNTTISSQKFGIESYLGKNMIDNVSVSDSVIPIEMMDSSSQSSKTTDFATFISVMSLFIASILIKRKNKSIK